MSVEFKSRFFFLFTASCVREVRQNPKLFQLHSIKAALYMSRLLTKM